MTLVPFARQSVGDVGRGFTTERALNWFAVTRPSAAAGEMKLEPSPGLTLRKDVDVGEVYALLELGRFLFIAAGGRLWRLNLNNNVLLELGNIAADPQTTMATTGTDVAVAAGGDLYVWQTDTSTFSQPSTGVFSAVGTVAAADGFYVISEANGKRFSYSAVNDATSWDALDFFTAEGSPDQVRRVLSAFQDFYLFGTRSIEIWRVVGGADVLARNPGGVIPRGITWPQSAVAMDDAVYWVGDDRIVYRARGYSQERVSTEGLEALLQSYSEDDDLAFFTFTWRGHAFYVVRFPDRPAWVFDAATGLWHERNTGVGDGRWIARSAAQFGDGWSLGTSTGIVADLGGLTDAGAVIVREAIGMPFVLGDEEVTLAEMTAHFETGDQDIGRDARVSLEVRRFVGNDWRVWSFERWRPLGRRGQDRTARWNALGRGRGFQLRLRLTDPLDAALYGVTYRPVR